MITKIGIVAGEIWHFLEKRDKVSLDDIVKQVDAPREVVLMSIGWLAREGHIVLEGETPNHVVSLRIK
jgi:hypothetical protein